MQSFPVSPKEMVASFWRNRELIYQMSKREVIGRYRGSIMGLTWSFINPLFMLVVYTFFFTVVFKARWGTGIDEGKADFSIILFVGLIIHGMFSECVNRAPGLIVTNANYVKKVVFPLEVLPWVAFGSALFHMFVSLIILLCAQIALNLYVPASSLFFPLVLLPLIFATMGLTWFLAALGVYIRDLGQVASMFTTALLFVSAVFFPLSILPEKYQFWLQLNPLAFIIEEGRKSLIFGENPDFIGLLHTMVVGLVMAWIGFAWFQKTRKGFADVL